MSQMQWIRLVSVISIILSIVACDNKPKDTPLLPEVEKVLLVTLDDKLLENNAHVALMGLTAPEDEDYYAAGVRAIKGNYQIFRQAIANKQPLNFTSFQNSESYYCSKQKPLTVNMSVQGKQYNWFSKEFSCGHLANTNCVANIINNKQIFQQLIQQNQFLLGRYKEIIKLPSYQSINDYLYLPRLDFGEIEKLSQLNIVNALYLIDEGDTQLGLSILAQEVTFAKKMLEGGDSIDVHLGLRKLYIIYHIVGNLLDSPQLADQLNSPLLAKILEPLSTKQQQAFVRAFAMERDTNLMLFYLSGGYRGSNNNVVFLPIWTRTQDKISLGDSCYDFAKWNFKFVHFNLNDTLNRKYHIYTSHIEKAKLTLPEVANSYLQPLVAPNLSCEAIYKEYGANNFIGGWITYKLLPSYDVFLQRLYDIPNYLALVDVKLRIKQAAITKQQVPTFLAQLGDKAKNPYSKKPFKWDGDKQQLSSDWIEATKDVSRYGERATISIQFK